MAVPAVQFREDALRAVIPVVRRGGANLEQSVAFTTRDGSAWDGNALFHERVVHSGK